MSNLNKLDFTVLEVSRRNYLKWVQGVKLHFTAKNLRPTVEEETDNPVGEAKKATAIIFIRRHTLLLNPINSQQQYRAQKFTKFSNLISVLLPAEKQNQLMMKNHQVRSSGGTTVSETHYSANQYPKRQKRSAMGGQKPPHKGQQSQGPSKGGNKAHKRSNLTPRPRTSRIRAKHLKPWMRICVIAVVQMTIGPMFAKLPRRL
ncbi:uncharacterized protein [Pyrus communis]|uniref:uncharacterized protein n=1 Tax=Pyrus communis TaxID=23211 RepID=UPI0035BF7CEC